MRRPTGLSLIEILVALTLFSIVSAVVVLLLSKGVGLWTEVIQAESAGLELAKANRALRKDLLLTSVNQCKSAPVPGLGGSQDGAALWFLSAIDPATGQMARKPDGTPFWQRNILYYLSVPAQHQQTFGIDCQGIAGPNGFDDRCPHKILVRKVIDSGVPTSSTDDPAATEEQLISDISSYLTRPDGYEVAAMAAEPGVEFVEPAAVRMLWFEVDVNPTDAPGSINVEFRAVAIDDARKHLVVGNDSLYEGRFTVARLLSLEPMN